MGNTVANLERIHASREKYRQKSRESAKTYAGWFVSNASYGCLRKVPALRQLVCDNRNRVSLAFLVKDEEIRDHFHEAIAEHPELAEMDNDGCLGEDGIVFVEAWLDEVCSRWSDIQGKL